MSGVECVVAASDPTVRGGATNPFGLRKTLRAMEIAERNRLPLVQLIESSGADLPTQSQIFIPGGAVFRNLARLSRAGIPTVSLVFGSSTAGAPTPRAVGPHHHGQERAKVFLGGPPLVRMATGEQATDEELGGAEMHARTSGLADQLADDERSCIRLGREVIANLGWRKPRARRAGRRARARPRGAAGPGPGRPQGPRRRARDPGQGGRRLPVLEWKPLYGASLCCGWASVHGYRVGVVANAAGVLFSEESNKAAHFIQLANQTGTPLLFLQNTTGYMVGKAYEQRGSSRTGPR